MHNDRARQLLQKHLDRSISGTEMDELTRYLDTEKDGGSIRDAMNDIIDRLQPDPNYNATEWDPLVNRIFVKGDRARVRAMVFRRLSVAAAILTVVTSGWLLLSRSGGRKEPVIVKRNMSTDIVPGSNKATLTFADSSTIALDEAKEGVIGQEGNVRVVKRSNGQLAYQPANHASAGTAGYNLLTTPRGGQYQLLLPDGSKVWLNAASSLRYPTNFTGDLRQVELTGEAYFEIANNASMPFHVKVAGRHPLDVEVLGTHFNVKAYAEEGSINTTLLEGAVRVQRGIIAVMPKPGEQASAKGDQLKISPVDVEEAIAWKNGLFKFNEATIEDVMRQLSRWYDVEVVYVNGVPKDLFRGEIYRNVNVSKVLKTLEASGVSFTVEGKTIYVK